MQCLPVIGLGIGPGEAGRQEARIDTRHGQRHGEAEERVDAHLGAVERTIERYRQIREPGERFLDCYRRVGMDPFKEAIYG